MFCYLSFRIWTSLRNQFPRLKSGLALVRLLAFHRFLEGFINLVKSIIDHPEMLELRECLVVEYADEFVAIAGNMRLRAVVEAASISDHEIREGQ